MYLKHFQRKEYNHSILIQVTLFTYSISIRHQSSHTCIFLLGFVAVFFFVCFGAYSHTIEPPAERLLRWSHESEEYSESELSTRFKAVYNLYQYSRKEAHHDHHRLRFLLQQLDLMSNKLLATNSLEDMDHLSEGYADYYYNLNSLDDESKAELYQQHYAHLDTAYIGSGFWRTQINELDTFVHPTDGQHLDEHYHDIIHAKHSLLGKEQQQHEDQQGNSSSESLQPQQISNQHAIDDLPSNDTHQNR